MRTFSKKMVGGLAVGAAMMFGSVPNASADFLTTLGVWQANDPLLPDITPSPITDPKIALNSTTITNTYEGVGIGAKVRTVYAGFVTSIFNGASNDPIRGVGNDDNLLVIVAALDGVVVASGGSPTVVFTSGRAGLIESTQSFAQADPTTWGFGTAAAPGTVAEWVLTAPQNVFPLTNSQATSAQFVFPAAIVNTSTLNTADPAASQARLLFAEDSAGAIPALPGGAVGDDFVNVDPAQIAALGALFTGAEGLIVDPRVTNINFNTSFNAAQQTILNDIGIWAQLGAVTGAAPNEGFADFGSGGANDYFVPANLADVLLNGDFSTSGQTEAAPGAFVGIPEPATALLGLFGLAALGARRRQKA